MPSIFTLEGTRRGRGKRGLSDAGDSPAGSESCRCIYNPRTKQHRKLCWVGKKAGKRGSGWKFVKGSCRP